MHRSTLSLPVVLCLAACGPEAFEMPERIEPEIAPQTPAAFVAACPVDSFIDLDVVDGPGPGYPQCRSVKKPELAPALACRDCGCSCSS